MFFSDFENCSKSISNRAGEQLVLHGIKKYLESLRDFRQTRVDFKTASGFNAEVSPPGEQHGEGRL